MIANQIPQQPTQAYTNAKYYPFTTIIEHVIDCFQTIVMDETNPYHPSWLTRKQIRPPDDELFLDLIEECSAPRQLTEIKSGRSYGLSSSIRCRLDKCSLEQRKEIVTRTKDGCSPLFLACRTNQVEIIRYLIDSCGADIEQEGHFEEAVKDHHVHSVSPLWVAAVCASLEAVEYLIEHGAHVNCLSDTGSTPLRSVCFQCGDDNGYSGKQEESYDIFGQDSHNQSNEDVHFKIVRLLVENGADISRPNHNGGTCLINSIHNYHLTEYILNHGADINAADYQSKTALHYAIEQGRLEVTKLLLSRGANPFLCANFCDDALQLCCLGGHLEIFKHLTKTVEYPKDRLADAYKLLGSSILELRYDLARVRELWRMALRLRATPNDTQVATKSTPSNIKECDIRRSIAFGDTTEFDDEHGLQSLSADDFRIQSLLITERVLGTNHRETIQRFLHRGTFYINALRPDRCIDLWIYALKLRLEHDSIFNFETIFAVQVITRMFIDLFSQQQNVKFVDVHDVVFLLVGKIDDCQRHLRIKPISSFHQEIFDLLLGIIVNLLFALNCVAEEPAEVSSYHKIVQTLARSDPRTSKGSSLLHMCMAPGVFDGEAARHVERYRKGISPLIDLSEALIANGLEPDVVNNEGLSALQMLCLSNVKEHEKKVLVKRLVDLGAHVDRRPSTPEQMDKIQQTLKEAGIRFLDHTSLACLAARKVAELGLDYDAQALTKTLNESIAIH